MRQVDPSPTTSDEPRRSVGKIENHLDTKSIIVGICWGFYVGLAVVFGTLAFKYYSHDWIIPKLFWVIRPTCPDLYYGRRQTGEYMTDYGFREAEEELDAPFWVKGWKWLCDRNLELWFLLLLFIVCTVLWIWWSGPVRPTTWFCYGRRK